MTRTPLHACGLMVRRAWHDLLDHGGVPGYAQLPWGSRCYLNLWALRQFLCSGECLRICSYLIIWLLAAQLLIWTRDLHGPAAAAPGLLASVWLWPWIASARRRRIAVLLRHRWPD